MGFQPGDQTVLIGGRPVTLRLTMGALAEISAKLSAPGPNALAEAMRRIGPDEARALLTFLSTPRVTTADAARLIDNDVLICVPALCAVFEEGFNARL